MRVVMYQSGMNHHHAGSVWLDQPESLNPSMGQDDPQHHGHHLPSQNSAERRL